MDRLKRLAAWVAERLPVILDICGLTAIVAGVWFLENSAPGVWLIVAGVGLILAGLRAQA